MMPTKAFPSLMIAGLTLAGLLASVEAAQPMLADEDCTRVLEQWATDAGAAPSAAVDTCRQQLAPAPVEESEAVDPMDALRRADLNPCDGADAAGSVLCWGPWAALAPAAGPEPLKSVDAPRGVDVVCRPELAEQCDADFLPLEPGIELPLGSCPPGTPCGFATVVDGVASHGEAEDTVFARFLLLPDGTAFTVDPEGFPLIVSVDAMGMVVTSRPDDWETLRANGRDGGEQSRVIARVLRDGDGEILLAADIWGHGAPASGAAQSGYFAWGTTTSAGSLEALRAAGASLMFTGPMSVDNGTTASVQVNFGGTTTWNGTWANPAYTFSAGGLVSGADLISQPGGFSANVVAPESFVQGALLGEQGVRALAHIIEVNVFDHGLVRDVGLLRELSPGPALPAGIGD
ncbi:MAG: hypothetical protein JJT85_03030 [Chromatiales bacterium]|nr:hypothetical protein [Chromatiales bacterium]